MILAPLFLATQAVPPESAAPPIGSKIRPSAFAQNQDPIDADTVRKMEKKMASCMVQSRAKLVVDLLSNSDQSAIDFDRLGIHPTRLQERLSMGSCLGSVSPEDMTTTLRFSLGKLRSNLAEEVYLERYKTPLSRGSNWTEVIGNRFIVNPEQASVSRLRGDFSDCMVFHDPAGADAMLRTPIGGPQERVAAQALVPALSKCFSDGDKLELTVSAIRSYAADGLWARSHYQSQHADEAVLAPLIPNEKRN